MPEQALLLDRRRLGVALRHDQAAQCRAVLAGNLLPRRLAHGVAEADLALGDRVGEKDPPAVIWHSDFSIMRPALRVDRNRGAQIDLRAFEIARPHLVPPLQELRLPVLERALQRAVADEVDVVRDLFRVIDRAHWLTSAVIHRRRAGASYATERASLWITTCPRIIEFPCRRAKASTRALTNARRFDGLINRLPCTFCDSQ